MRLDAQDHGSLVLWAADCAERVLPYFEGEHPEDDRPRNAIEARRAWVRGEIAVGEARAAAFDAHASNYALTAVVSGGGVGAEERDRQYRRLPEHLRPAVFPARGDD